jgi:hypothetical protein
MAGATRRWQKITVQVTVHLPLARGPIAIGSKKYVMRQDLVPTVRKHALE